MKQQGNKNSKIDVAKMADTMVDVISMFDKAYGKPDDRKNETPEQLRRSMDRLCGVSHSSRKRENKRVGQRTRYNEPESTLSYGTN